MSVHAGTILHVGGRNVIDRIQSAGLGDVRIPTEVIREVGNYNVVDKVPGDADFTFSLSTLDVSTEIEAWLTGGVAAGTGSAQAAGFADPDGTAYKWSNCGFVNIISPWKNPATGSAGAVYAGHIVPGYYATRIRYQFGVSDNATEEVELAGGSFYYAGGSPTEEFATGDGSTTAYPTSTPAIPYRKGGAEGTTFKSVFGVIVDGDLKTEGVDYTTSPTNSASTGIATITFATAPANGAKIRFTYFSTTPAAYPQTVHAATVVKPGAVRGRHIRVSIGNGTLSKIPSVQSFQLEATVDQTVDREFDNEEIVGITINGRDCNGEMTVRSKDAPAFLALLSRFTGVSASEVQGYINTHEVELKVEILNPKNPAQVLKTLYVADAVFSIPGTPARVNQPTDFSIRWESTQGDFTVYKGQRP